MKIHPLQIRPAFHRAVIMQSTILQTLQKDSQCDEGQSGVKMVSKICCRPRGVNVWDQHVKETHPFRV